MAITKESLQNFASNPMGIVGDIFAVTGTVNSYKQHRKEGDNAFVSGVKSLGEFAYSEMYYTAMNNGISKITSGLGGFKGMITGMGIMQGVELARTAAGLMGNYFSNTGDKYTKGYKSRGGIGSGYFDMTEAGYTMRQRSLNAIQQNGLNTQSALGNEAREYFRGSM